MAQSQADEVLVWGASLADLVAGAGLKFSEPGVAQETPRYPRQMGSVCCERIARYWRHSADVEFMANDRFAPEAAGQPGS